MRVELYDVALIDDLRATKIELDEVCHELDYWNAGFRGNHQNREYWDACAEYDNLMLTFDVLSDVLEGGFLYPDLDD